MARGASTDGQRRHRGGIAEDDDAPLAEIRARVAKSLPIRAQAAEAQVMRLGADGWRTRSRILLGRSEGHDPREPLFL
jgi:hypothetical protein